jgi:hypothetical protein
MAVCLGGQSAERSGKLKRVESATGPKILVPGFFALNLQRVHTQGLKSRPSQALTRSFNESFFGAWFSHGNF